MHAYTKTWIIGSDGDLDELKLILNETTGRIYIYINDIFVLSNVIDKERGEYERFTLNIRQHVCQVQIHLGPSANNSVELWLDGKLVTDSTASLATTENGTSASKVQVVEEQKCPYCESIISSTAAKCRYCGEWIDTPPTPQRKIQASPQSKKKKRQRRLEPRKESVLFALFTLLIYLLFFPAGLLLNLLGLLTGPNRGCFRQLFFIFVLLPVLVIIFLTVVTGISIEAIFDTISNFMHITF